jgi:hypothetical protein
VTASPSPQHATRKKRALRRALELTAITFAVIAVILVLFKLGEKDRPDSVTDTKGDVGSDASAGESGVEEIDIVEAEVTRDGSSILFRARVASGLSATTKRRPVTFRWNLLEDGQETWFLVARLENKVVASLVSTETNYGASTNDDTLPGHVTVTDDRILVRISPDRIPDFPTTFDWELEAALFADPKQPSSPTATDRAPDSGFGHL